MNILLAGVLPQLASAGGDEAVSAFHQIPTPQPLAQCGCELEERALKSVVVAVLQERLTVCIRDKYRNVQYRGLGR